MMSQDPCLLRHRAGRFRAQSAGQDQLHILKSQMSLTAHQFVIVAVVAPDNFKNPRREVFGCNFGSAKMLRKEDVVMTQPSSVLAAA